jgi:hypothetical protein
MKKLFILLLFLSLTHLSNAQDYILKRDGNEVYGNITEISSTEIRYNDTINKSVIRVLNKSDVFMIKFRNGMKEVYAQEVPKTQVVIEAPPVSKNTGEMEGPIINLGSNDFSINGKIYHYTTVKQLLLSLGDPAINKLLVQARMEYIFGNFLAYSSIPVGIIALALISNGIEYGGAGYFVGGSIAGALCISANAANIFFKIDKNKKLNEAIAIYNKKIAETSAQ